MATLATIPDRGNINLSSSGISGDVVTIYPQKYQTHWRNFYFKITGANGWQPDFKCVWDGFYLIALADAVSTLRPRYTYTPDDPSSWIAATSQTQDGTYLNWTFDSAFSQDTVYIALYEPVPVGMITSWLSGLSGISEPASAIAYGGDTYQYGVIPQVTDENSRVIPAQKQHCFKFGTGSTDCIIFGGVHAGEDFGSLNLMRAVDFLLGSDPVAEEARRQYTFYCYPMINPQGRYGGHFRYTFESGYLSQDPNRDWDNFNLVCTQNTRDAVATDITSFPGVELLIDFHDKEATAVLHRSNVTANQYDLNFIDYLTDYQSVIPSSTYTLNTGSTREYYNNQGVVNLYTPEYGLTDYTVNKYDPAVEMGVGVAATISRMEWVASTETKNIIDFDAGNTSRYYKILSDSVLSFPDGDWTFAFWLYLDEVAGANYQYAFSQGTHGAANSISVVIRESGVSVAPNQLRVTIVDSANNTIIMDADIDAEIPEKKLIFVRRKDDVFKIYELNESGKSASLAQSTATFGTITANDMYIGGRSDLDSARFYGNHLGVFFRSDFAFERYQMDAIAWGLGDPADCGTLTLDLAMDSPDATLTDAASGLTATRYGLSWPAPSVSVIDKALLPINVTGVLPAMTGVLSRKVRLKRSVGGSI